MLERTKQTTLYASYGVLAHEYETVWGAMWAEGAVDADKVTVELPEGYEFIEGEFPGTMVVDSEGESCFLWECLVRTGDEPAFYFPGKDGVRKVPLTVVARQGYTVW